MRGRTDKTLKTVSIKSTVCMLTYDGRDLSACGAVLHNTMTYVLPIQERKYSGYNVIYTSGTYVVSL